MKTVLSQLDGIVRKGVADAFGLECDALVGVSQNEKFGDYQSNAAMTLAKPVMEKTGVKTNPRAVAEQIKAKLDLGDMASEVTIAGPGFINVRLSPGWVAGQLNAIVSDDRLGIEVKEKQKIVVDYSGPNIAKEMHVGHLRSTIIGDAVSRVLEFQMDDEHPRNEERKLVTRQNHIGDWGTQFGRVVLAMWYESMAEYFHQSQPFQAMVDSMRTANDETKAKIVHDIAELNRQWFKADKEEKIFDQRIKVLQISLPKLESVYQFVSAVTDHPAAKTESVDGIRLSDIPRRVTIFIQNHNKDENLPEKTAWEKARDVTLKTVAEIYAQLDVKLQPADVRGESAYQDDLSSVVDELMSAGVAVESEGAIVVTVPGYEAPLMIRKSDGGFLYGTTDLAAIRYRIKTLGAQRIIYTHDSRQIEHFKKVFWTAEKIGWGSNVSLEYAPFGTILGEDGRPFRTRSGDTVKLKALLDEAQEKALTVVTEKQPDLPDDRKRAIAHAVGIGAVKYGDFSKDRVSDYVFSFEKMLALDGNTAPYLQYAHARVRSIFRKAGDAKPGTIRLESSFELALGKHILRLGEVIEVVGRELKPHHLCTYLYELATRFSGFFENCPVIQSEPETRASRLSLCDLTARTLERGLDLLGIEHPDQM
jgi:arginyl-tRNA synthetase